MTSKRAKILLFFIACTLQKVVAQSLDSLPYTLTVGDDVLGMELRSEQEAKQSMYILSRSEGNADQSMLSSTLITKEEVEMSGATSLLEVLRLSPEVLVQQSTNGNYTLHLRGSSSTDGALDNRNAVLLMINEIPYYDFLEQSVWWEALPIALQDIEQVEIVRFSHSAWFGPEATDGVINIVTKSDNGSGFRAQVNSQAGLRGNYWHQGSISLSQGGRFRARASAFYNQRSRFQNSYYVFNPQQYIAGDSLLFYQVDAQNTNPNFKTALGNSGIHVHADYRWSAQADLQVSAGTQNSEAQGVFRRIEEIALTNRSAATNWLSLRSHWKSLTAYVSYQSGARSYVGYEEYRPDDTQQLQGKVEYAHQWKKYRLGAGAEVLRYEYKDSETDTVGQEKRPTPFSPTLEQRYSMNLSQQLSLSKDRLRLTLANRGDYYQHAGQLLLNHQLSASYNIYSSHNLYTAISYGNRPPDIQSYLAADTMGLALQSPTTTVAYEARYQYQIAKHVRSELTYFNIQPIGQNDSSLWANISQYRRSGITGKLDWQINRLYLSGFVTGMRYHAHEEFIIPFTLPHFMGGITGKYTALFGKLQAHASAYYYSNYELSQDELLYEVPAKITLSGKLSYRIWEGHSVFFSSQNLLDNRNAERPFGDKTRGMYWIGVNLRF